MKRSRKNKTSLGKIIVIILIIFAGFLYLDYIYKKKPKPPRPKPKIPVFIVKPKIAIIIDDMGYSKEAFEELAKLNIKLTFSFFPGGTYTKVLASEAYSKGFDCMLHLPMEPISFPKDNPGNDAVFVNMDKGKIKKLVEKHLKSVPFIVGVNNHMGSRATQEKDIMLVVLNEVKTNNLIFVDSLTTEKSTAEKAAKEIGFKILKRDIFLDSEQSDEFTKNALKRLVAMAKKRKRVLAIGHPLKSTINALREEIPFMLGEGMEFVPVSQLYPDIK